MIPTSPPYQHFCMPHVSVLLNQLFMKKIYLTILMILCIAISSYIAYRLWKNHDTYLWTSKWGNIQYLSGNSVIWVDKKRIQQQVLFWVAPTVSSDCEKFSNTDKENCLFSIAIRSAKNATDTSGCKKLSNPKRCEKAIADQFSSKFNISNIPLPPATGAPNGKLK